MSEEKKLEIAIKRACEIMVKSGIGDWKVKLNRKRTSLAETSHYKKTIAYSKHFIMVATEKELEGVTYHETAHALLGSGHGHDKTFKDLCTSLVGDDSFSTTHVDVSVRKYIYECPECGSRGGKNQLKKLYCRRCLDKGKEVLFNSRENKIVATPW